MSARTSPHCILVVEDNPVALKMVRIALEAEGHRVLEAASGSEALEHLRLAPDLVLQDLGLSDMNGFELAARIRQAPQGKDIPIVAFTGLLSAADKAKAGALGITDFLAKPIEPSRLVQSLASWLGSRTPLVAAPGHGRRLLVVDDDPTQLKLARLRLEDAGFAVETAGSGPLALERAWGAPPAAIVSDVLMPEIDGFQLALLVRRDPRLQNVPIVLMTSHYVEESDENLARRMGASGFALRSPSFDGVLNAVLRALDSPLPPVLLAEDRELDRDYQRRVAHQLERQAAMNAGLFERVVLLSSSLSVLTTISRALADRQDIEVALGEALNSCLDAAGLSKGALHVAEERGHLRLVAQAGLQGVEEVSSSAFFAPPELEAQVLAAEAPLALPSASLDSSQVEDFLGRLVVRSALVVPIRARNERLGFLTLGSQSRALVEQAWIPLATAVASQLALAITLARAFRSREAAIAALRVRERAIGGLPDALLIVDARRPDHPVLDVNPGFERMTGYAASEVVGREYPFLPPDSPHEEARRALVAAFAQGTSAQVEVEDRRRDGSSFWKSVELTPVRDDSGQLTHFVAAMRDTTEKRRLEQQLRQAQKMEAVGQLAGGVAHDFNNLLGVITGYGQLLLNELAARHPGRRRVELILRAAERAAALTRQLLAFGRKQILQPRVIELDRVVGDLEPMLRRLLGEQVQIVTLRPAQPVTVKADPGQMEQIVMNLAVNARDAMPEGGRLLIETREVVLTESEARERPGTSAGRFVELSVRDEGTGMTPGVRSHIFEPFYTTKEPGRGTGLGLATVYGIVKQSGGHIGVESEVGKGTCFTIHLPYAEPEAARPPLATPRSTARRGRHSILLVEDDDALRDLTREVLEKAGHRVRAARRPSEALEASGEPEAHLFLLDVVLPEMSGPELFLRLRERHRGARVLYLSGYANESIARHLEAGTPYLKKPFRPEELLARIEELLAS